MRFFVVFFKAPKSIFLYKEKEIIKKKKKELALGVFVYMQFEF